MKISQIYRQLLNENSIQPNISLIKTNDYLVLLDTVSNNIIGVVTYEKIEDGLFHVPAIAAEKGYGFLLYQIVMSIVSPSYIITDRDSSTTYAAVKTLKRMYDDMNIEHVTLDKNDVNYVFFKQESEEYNILINTKFRIKILFDYSQMENLGLEYSKNINLDDLNEKAFEFFSRKLNEI